MDSDNFFRPDLGQNCLQRLSADNTIRQSSLMDKKIRNKFGDTAVPTKSDRDLIFCLQLLSKH